MSSTEFLIAMQSAARGHLDAAAVAASVARARLVSGIAEAAAQGKVAGLIWKEHAAAAERYRVAADLLGSIDETIGEITSAAA